MKYFRELVETIQRDGVFVTTPDNGWRLCPISELKTYQLPELVEQNNVFVFYKSTDETIQNEFSKDLSIEKGVSISDAPFKVFSIEMESGPLPSQSVLVDESVKLGFKPYCILCEEIKPNKFRFITLIKDKDGKYPTIIPSTSEKNTVNYFLSLLKTQQTGLESVRLKLKIGKGSQKRFHTINHVIHICPKKDVSNYAKGTKHIDWTHRFSVRGHWRKQNGLGKDRQGIYCIDGFTWVTEHVRGPEHLPLVKKTRLVKEKDSQIQ